MATRNILIVMLSVAAQSVCLLISHTYVVRPCLTIQNTNDLIITEQTNGWKENNVSHEASCIACVLSWTVGIFTTRHMCMRMKGQWINRSTGRHLNALISFTIQPIQCPVIINASKHNKIMMMLLTDNRTAINVNLNYKCKVAEAARNERICRPTGSSVLRRGENIVLVLLHSCQLTLLLLSCAPCRRRSAAAAAAAGQICTEI